MSAAFRTTTHLRWRPTANMNSWTLRRFASSIAPRVPKPADFGPANPPGQPKTGLPFLYTVEPKTRPGSWSRFMKTAKPEAAWLAGAVIGVGAYSAATLAIPSLLGQLIDGASVGYMPMGTSTRLVCVFAIAGVANFVRLALVGIAGESIICKLRSRLYRAMIGQPAPFFDAPDNRTGALVQRLSSDCNVVGASLSETMTSGSKNLLQTLGSLTVMFYYSPTLCTTILLALPPVVMFAGIVGRKVRRLQVQMQDAIAKQGVVAEERLGAIRTVKAFGRETEELKWFDTQVNNVFKISRHMLVFNAGYVGLLHFFGYMTLYTMLWAGSMLVSANEITGGTLFSFVLYMVYCGIGFVGLTQTFTDLNKGYGASLRVYDIIDRHDDLLIAQSAEKQLKLLDCKWNIKFENVNFAYPTRPEAPIYSGLTVDIAPMKCTCIVGSSGSGKSTMANLLLKLYKVDGGYVTIDGTDVADLDTAWLRAAIGYVGQEPVLFGGSISQNVAYGSPFERNWDEPVDKWQLGLVVDACARANAHDFITALPEGYNTYVGEQGRSLSGGQKQRIAIARALIRNPHLLILDEATSALDAESEIVVQEAIEKLIGDTRKGNTQRAVLMFAHKLSMIRNADHVVLLDGGRVVDQGTFEYISRNPMFRAIVGLTDKENHDPHPTKRLAGLNTENVA